MQEILHEFSFWGKFLFKRFQLNSQVLDALASVKVRFKFELQKKNYWLCIELPGIFIVESPQPAAAKPAALFCT